MTPELEGAFRSLFKLRHLGLHDDPKAFFDSLVSLAVWHYREKKQPGLHNDRLLLQMQGGSPTAPLYMGLLMHLASVDRPCFDLARRMGAATLLRDEPLQMLHRQVAAWLLLSDPPVQRKPKLVRDVVVIVAVAFGQKAGWHPTEAPGSNEPNRSGCARFANALQTRLTSSLSQGELEAVNYDAIAKVWGRREARLTAAGFSKDIISDFSSAICPMTKG